MKGLVPLILIFSIVILCDRSTAETIRFAPLPMERQQTVLNRFRPLTEYIAGSTQLSVDYVYTDSYEDLLDKFRNQEIDLAYLGPLAVCGIAPVIRGCRTDCIF